MTNAIVVRGANKHYGDFAALDNVDFEVPSGSLTALLGPSGSGKSTLLRAIAGLDLPDTGTVTINGRDVTQIPPQRRGIGFVFQHYAAFKHLTVRDNVAFGLKIRKRPKGEIKEKVDNLLEVVGLSGFQTRYPNQLSGGQRQRMALARALAVDPEVLLLDEPFGALDAKVREDLRAWLRRLHDEVHVTTVLVTHDQSEALDVADRIAVLNKGRIEQVGSPTDVYDAPANAFVMSFLGAVSSLNGSLVRPHDIRVGRAAGHHRSNCHAGVRSSRRADQRGRPHAFHRADHPRRRRGTRAEGRRYGLRAGDPRTAIAGRHRDPAQRQRRRGRVDDGLRPGSRHRMMAPPTNRDVAEPRHEVLTLCKRTVP
jgi:sulfate transport system ATP-binding protein